MTPKPMTIKLNATVREAASLLTERCLSSAVVVNDNGRPVGSISRIDIVRHAGCLSGSGRETGEFFLVDDLVSWSSTNRFHSVIPEVPGRTVVRQAMQRKIHSIQGTASAAKVVEEMLTRRVQRLLVVGDEGQVIGTVIALDVLRNLRH